MERQDQLSLGSGVPSCQIVAMLSTPGVEAILYPAYTYSISSGTSRESELTLIPNPSRVHVGKSKTFQPPVVAAHGSHRPSALK